MAFGTPTTILTGGFAGAVGPPYTTAGTSAPAPAGSTIAISFAPYDSAGVPFVTAVIDSVGNVYFQEAATSAYAVSGGFSSTALWVCVNASNTLPASGTFTASGTWSSAIGISIGTAFYFTGPNGGSDQSAVATNTGLVTTLSVGPTGSLATPSDIVIAVAGSRSSFGTWTEGSGFTTLSNAGADVTSYQLVSSTSPITWSPSWVNAVPFGAVLASFNPPPAPPPLTTGFSWSEC